jgi:hypothetical protein
MHKHFVNGLLNYHLDLFLWEDSGITMMMMSLVILYKWKFCIVCSIRKSQWGEMRVSQVL